jgi:tRNA pseudouridine55 synthase
MFSAIKQGGVPLYKLARKGVEVERELREVEIHSLVFDWIRLPEACFTVRCSRGTYVRTLACDIGEALGCGAHLLELRRTQSGLFVEAQAVTMEQLRAATDPTQLLFPLDRALAHLSAYELSEEAGKRLLNGIAPVAQDLPDKVFDGLRQDDQVRLYVSGRLAAVARFDQVRGLKLARVFN